MLKIAVSTPAYGDVVYTAYVQSLLRLVRTFEQRQWPSLYTSISYADIVESRNFLLTHWFDKTDASHLLFVDADMGFDPQLVIDMISLDQPFVGVVSPKRQIDLMRLAKLAADGEPAQRALARSHSFVVNRNERSNDPVFNGFLEVDSCGAGILLIKRSCVETLIERFPAISDAEANTTSPLAKHLDRLIRAFDPVTINGARLSEDFSFCHRWRQCGGKVWANISHEITHIGLHAFKSRYQDVVGGVKAIVRVPSITRKTKSTTTDQAKTITGSLSAFTKKK